MKSLLILLLMGIMVLVAPTACRPSSVVDRATPTRTLISSALVTNVPAAQLRSRYTGVSAVLQFLVRYGIRVYRLEYSTTNTDGTRIKASGAVIIPVGPTMAMAMPMLSMQHRYDSK